MSEDRPNIHQQIAEIEREIGMRRKVYPGWVSRGKMRQAEADFHLQQIGAVLDTLLWCRDHRETIAAVDKAAKPLVTLGPAQARHSPRTVLTISVPPGAVLSPETRDTLIGLAESAVAQLRAMPGGATL